MYDQFHAVFPSDGGGPKPYDQNGVREIETFRKTFGGVLFVDRILKALGIGEGKTAAAAAYPPRGGEAGLRALHAQICAARVPAHPRASVLYYLLLDHDGVRGPRSRLADDFASSAGLPRTFQMLMRGLWHMDRREFRNAITNLAHPSLPTEFPDEIITTLIRHHDDRDGNDVLALALAYYHAAQPVLRTAEAQRLLFGALARTSVSLAFYHTRRYPEPARQMLVENLVAAALVMDEDAASGGGSGGGTRTRELVSLPLDEVEEGWVRGYLTTGEGRKARGARKMLELRDVLMGRRRGW